MKNVNITMTMDMDGIDMVEVTYSAEVDDDFDEGDAKQTGDIYDVFRAMLANAILDIAEVTCEDCGESLDSCDCDDEGSE